MAVKLMTGIMLNDKFICFIEKEYATRFIKVLDHGAEFLTDDLSAPTLYAYDSVEVEVPTDDE